MRTFFAQAPNRFFPSFTGSNRHVNNITKQVRSSLWNNPWHSNFFSLQKFSVVNLANYFRADFDRCEFSFPNFVLRDCRNCRTSTTVRSLSLQIDGWKWVIVWHWLFSLHFTWTIWDDQAEALLFHREDAVFTVLPSRNFDTYANFLSAEIKHLALHSRSRIIHWAREHRTFVKALLTSTGW